MTKEEFIDKCVETKQHANGEWYVSRLDADIIGDHRGAHIGFRKGDHVGDHWGIREGDHFSVRIGNNK